jgi:hypothetical protein
MQILNSTNINIEMKRKQISKPATTEQIVKRELSLIVNPQGITLNTNHQGDAERRSVKLIGESGESIVHASCEEYGEM